MFHWFVVVASLDVEMGENRGVQCSRRVVSISRASAMGHNIPKNKEKDV